MQRRWRKALLISAVTHCVFILLFALVAAQYPQAMPQEEEIIELTFSDSPEVDSRMPTAAPGQAQLSQAAQALPAMTAMSPVAARVVVPTASMAMEAVEDGIEENAAPAAATAGSAPSGGGNSGVSSSAAGSGSAGGGNGGGAGGYIRPSILSSREPDYPEDARSRNIEGTVEVRVQILSNGRAGEVSVKTSSGYRSLDAAAIAAVRDWLFVPAKKRSNGQAISCYSSFPVRFRLH